MYPKEQPHPAPKESWPAGLPKYEDIRPKERDLLGKMWTAAGDFVRDVDTANKMAKDKFEGDTALMHAARGAVTTGVGMGLEKAMDYVWDSVWKGDIPFYDKAKFNPKMAEALNKFALANEKNARLTYFIKEATQDLSISLFYNFMAFRSQPILPKAGPGHLIASIGADAVEAMVRPTLPHEVNQAAQAGIVGMTENQIENKRREWLNFMRNGKVTVPFRAGETRDGEAIVRTMSKNVLEAETNQAKAELDDLMKGRDAAELKLN